jgi:hypothetical protein
VVGPADRQTQIASPIAPQNRMSYPITDAISDRTPEVFAATTNSVKAEYLLNEGAFTFANTEVCLSVLQAYFEWFHPCFPILDRFEIYKQHNFGHMSPLLFQAVLFIGASYCDDNTVHRMGFKDRPDAKQQLYNRAKALYDLDWENNKLTVLQSLFLISFWRAGPLNEKNTRYWLGAAISLAQTRGFHRSYVSFLEAKCVKTANSFEECSLKEYTPSKKKCGKEYGGQYMSVSLPSSRVVFSDFARFVIVNLLRHWVYWVYRVAFVTRIVM